MTLLLDTGALLWWLVDDPRLSAAARGWIRDPENTIHVSSASAWEVATKYRLGKLPEAGEIAESFPELVRRARFTPLPITLEHARRAGGFSVDHRDPFDRMLAAQSRIEGFPLVTRDVAFRRFPVTTVW